MSLRRSKNIKIVALIAIAVLTTSLASCTGFSKEEYEKKATEIVKNTREKISKTQSGMKSPEEMSSEEQKKVIQKFSGIFKEALAELDKIKPPADYKKGHNYLKKNYELGQEYMNLTAEAVDTEAKGKNIKEVEKKLMEIEKELETVQTNIGKELPFLEEFLKKG